MPSSSTKDNLSSEDINDLIMNMSQMIPELNQTDISPEDKIEAIT